ncbi:hypothetical protein ES332_A06G250000v1 [Gossypium tomentosum]|uniref:Uncharacterized protein n=1 Tax=Gossypium tomentosum TaxID=34277 RepID=A0A5D2Q8W4_GOSTO|nr:hypothetical protein ES332_A06G250000v1 [Gossypium tomentosum]
MRGGNIKFDMSNQHQRTWQQNISNSTMEVLLGLLNLLMMRFSVDLTIGPMSLVLKDCNKSVDDQWVNEFSKLHVDDWAEEFDRQAGEGALGDCSCDNWANSYDEFLSSRTLQGVSMYFLI